LLAIVLGAVGGASLLCIFIIILVLLLRSKKKEDEEKIDEEVLQERQPTNPPVLESEVPKSKRPTNTLQQVRKLTGIVVKNRLGTKEDIILIDSLQEVEISVMFTMENGMELQLH
jgi:hypothetical protein